MKQLSILFLFINFYGFAQTKGIVVDENNKPIPYVNIWVENENIGATSEENGQFTINTEDKNKVLVLSSLGFENKKVKVSEAEKVVLKAVLFTIDEVVIGKRKKTKQIEIGQTKNQFYQAYDNGLRIDVKYFPYKETYTKTKFIKKVSIETDSKIDNATFKIHFYSVDSDGFPGKELLEKDYIVSVNKGVKKTSFDLTRFDLTIPLNGIFIGFEKLMIEKNKVEKTTIDPNNNKTQISKVYYPLILYSSVERDFLFTYSGGKWNKKTNQNSGDLSEKIMIEEPVINLILSN